MYVSIIAEETGLCSTKTMGLDFEGKSDELCDYYAAQKGIRATVRHKWNKSCSSFITLANRRLHGMKTCLSSRVKERRKLDRGFKDPLCDRKQHSLWEM